MDNKEYLNEEKYKRIKKILIIIGCVSLIVGLSLFIGSFFINVPDMQQQNWFEAKRMQTLIRFLAFPFGLMIPLMTFSLAFRREMISFSTQQVMPVAQEGIDKMSPTISKAFGTIAKGIKDGLKDDDSE